MSELKNRGEGLAHKNASKTSEDAGSLNPSAPDYALVIPRKEEDKLKSSIDLLEKNGFYVSTQPSSDPGSVLVLLRARPEGVATLGTLTPAKRALFVQQSIVKAGIDLNSGFPIGEDVNYNKAFATNYLKKPFRSVSIAHVQAEYGDQLATYFAFAQFTNHSFLGPAIAGTVIYFTAGSYSPFIIPVLLLWSLIHVFAWRRKEAVLAAQYPSPGDKVEGSTPSRTARVNFKGLSLVKRQVRQILFWPFLLSLMVLYAIGLLVILGIEIFATQLYDGPAKGIVKFAPIGANIVASQIYALVYGFVVAKWTQWEDYATEEEFEAVTIQRKFYLTLLLNYTPLFLTAYLYLPFGNLIIGALVELRQSIIGEYVALVPSFSLDTARLSNQAFFYSVTNQIINVAMTLVLPLVFVLNKQFRGSGKGTIAALEKLGPLDVNARTSDLVSLFGYVLLVSPVWPLAPLAALIGSWIHIKASLILLGYATRTPVIRLGHSIGKWNSDLLFLSGLSAVTVPTIIHMYGWTSPHYSISESLVDVTFISTLAIAFVAENVFLGLVHIASTVFSALPDPTLALKHKTSHIPEGEVYSQTPADQAWSSMNTTKPQ